VTTFTRLEVANAAGVDVDRVDQLVGLGILHPSDADRFSAGDIRRVTTVLSLAAVGIPLEALAANIARGALSLDFLDDPAYDRFSSLGGKTFRELSDETGVPFDLLKVVREASGFAEPSPEDRVRVSETAIVPFIELQLAEGFKATSIERLLRTMGDSLRRIAASEGDWWQSEVVAPRLGAGLTVGEAINPEFTTRIAEMAEQTLITIYHAHQTQAWTRNIFDGFERSLIDAGLYVRLERPPAICFLDITGFTRLTHERGDAAAVELADDLARLVQRTSARFDGRPIKWLGDGVMFWFRDPGPAVVAALDMVDDLSAAGLPPAHVGLHAGPVVFQEGDYYGQTVNLASRIGEYARPGEVLVSQAVIDASSTPTAVFTSIGPVELKGMPAAVDLFSAHRSREASRQPVSPS
jgi:class 3 adenylate cyclase